MKRLSAAKQQTRFALNPCYVSGRTPTAEDFGLHERAGIRQDHWTLSGIPNGALGGKFTVFDKWKRALAGGPGLSDTGCGLTVETTDMKKKKRNRHGTQWGRPILHQTFFDGRR